MPRILIHPDGREEVVEEPTASDPRGDAPRTADGVLIGNDGLPVPDPLVIIGVDLAAATDASGDALRPAYPAEVLAEIGRGAAEEEA